MFDKRSLIRRLRELPFSRKEYWVVAGGAMVLHGFRQQTRDIDLGCSTLLADQLERQGYPVSRCDDGTRKILYSEDVEIFENWLEGTVELVSGVPVIRVDGLIEMKKKLGREKDLADIARIGFTRKDQKTMISMEDYKKNPCKAFSIPYWKGKGLTVPANMKIIHKDEFDEKLLDDYLDSRFFRLKHSLNSIPELRIPEVKLEVIQSGRIKELADMINRSYAHSEIRVSEEDIRSLTATPVYCPELWIGAMLDDKLIGSILCDFDAEVGEAIVEWLQVLPEYRGRGIASALVCRALKTMRRFADFATVSGDCDNVTNPERVYRNCGFEGNDVWHILREKS